MKDANFQASSRVPVLTGTLERIGRIAYRCGRACYSEAAYTPALHYYFLAAELGYRPELCLERAGDSVLKVRHPDVKVSHNCLVETKRPDWELAGRLFQASQNGSGTRRVALKSARALQNAGHFGDAALSYRNATSRGLRDGTLWYREGLCHVRSAAHAGGYTRRDLEASQAAFQRALNIDPNYLSAVSQLVRVLIRKQDWSGVRSLVESRLEEGRDSQVAAFGHHVPISGLVDNTVKHPRDEVRLLLDVFDMKPPDRMEIREVLRHTRWETVRTFPAWFWFPLHWRLVSLGWITEAAISKLRWAELLTLSGQDQDLPFGRVLQRAQAFVYQQKHDEAERLIESTLGQRYGKSESRVLQGLRADIRLSMGNVFELEQDAFKGPYHRDLMRIEERFRAEIEGRRVAVVGPAVSVEANGQEIDDCDVVIRTSLPQDGKSDTLFLGSRTDVLYPAIGRAVYSADGIKSAILNGGIRFVVMRSMWLEGGRSEIDESLNVRPNSREYAGSFRSAPFAMQRIIHDCLKYAPSELKVFNATLFVEKGQNYYAGYRDDLNRAFDDNSIVRPPAAFAHDYFADFLFTQSLWSSGLISVDRDLASVLRLSVDEYLGRLDDQMLELGESPATGNTIG